jgi:hypothetical protein
MLETLKNTLNGKLLKIRDEKSQISWPATIAEFLVWPLPALLAAFAHLFALPKAHIMSGPGPGWNLVIVNEETINAQLIWWFVDSLPHPFLLYAMILLAVLIILRMRHVCFLYRIIILVLLSIPGLWYFNIESYLGGKFIAY